MISPEEIKKKALKWWLPLLQSHIKDEPFFPRQIDRIGKVRPDQVMRHFKTLTEEIDNLYRNSKNTTKKGYVVKTVDRNFRRTGSHELPECIVIETIEDYLHVTEKKTAWKLFLQSYKKITQNIPLLKEWALNNVLFLVQPAINWDDILKVCRYFTHTPRPDLYLRQLPVEVHTKFIEENSSLLQSLLDFLIPAHIRNPRQKKFAERYYLRYDEPLIRIRILDKQSVLSEQMTDISIPKSAFEKKIWPENNILITENKMNFLTLPALASTISVWSGGGFHLRYLKNAGWLKSKNVYYWGDIDEHGFQILHQLRGYFPQAKSIMMDSQTYETFKEFTVNGQRNRSENLYLLNDEESRLYHFLKSLETCNRLEQEKISQQYAEEKLLSAMRRDGLDQVRH